MKKMDRKKLIEEFRKIRSSIKEKLTPGEINDEIKTYRKAKSRD